MSENADRPLAPKTPVTSTSAVGARSHGLGIYKFGQGYWVRMMTASCIFLLSIAAGAWGWSVLAVIRPPMAGYTIVVSDLVGTPKDGEPMTIVSGDKKEANGDAVVLAKTTVGHASMGQSGKTIITIGTAEGVDAVSLKGATLSGAGSPASFVGRASSAEGIAKFEVKWIQTSAAVVVIVIGLGLAYWLAGQKTGSVDFLVSTDGEMKKVNWSTRKAVIDSTIMVVGACFLIAGFLFVVDIGFKAVFAGLGVLKTG